jgi:LemA protein
MVVVEKYPELKASENFRDLQVQLEGTENRIAVERRGFNEAVQDYNTAVRRMPAAIVAGFSGFKETPYFEAEPQASKAPQVKF